MKVASVIFILFGMVMNFFCFDVYGAGIIIPLIGVGIGCWMLWTLADDKKSVAAGALGIFFTGLLGGILYLCWNPEN